jgi:hypothetical protein
VSSFPFAGGEGASEARVGRPSLNFGWRARARGVVKAAPSEHSSVEGVPGRRNRCPLTRRRRNRSWSTSKGVSALFRGRRQGTSEVDSPSTSAAENAVAMGRRTRVHRSEEPTRNVRSPKPRRETRIIRERIGRSWERNVNGAFTRVVCWGLGSVARDALRASVSLTPRIERSGRCSCRESVAEIGETHLPRSERAESRDSLRTKRR